MTFLRPRPLGSIRLAICLDTAAWALTDAARDRRRRALLLIGAAFVALAIYLAVQSTIVLVIAYHPRHSVLGIAWTAVTKRQFRTTGEPCQRVRASGAGPAG